MSLRLASSVHLPFLSGQHQFINEIDENNVLLRLKPTDVNWQLNSAAPQPAS
jgi:hypothetical protein